MACLGGAQRCTWFRWPRQPARTLFRFARIISEKIDMRILSASFQVCRTISGEHPATGAHTARCTRRADCVAAAQAKATAQYHIVNSASSFELWAHDADPSKTATTPRIALRIRSRTPDVDARSQSIRMPTQLHTRARGCACICLPGRDRSRRWTHCCLVAAADALAHKLRVGLAGGLSSPPPVLHAHISLLLSATEDSTKGHRKSLD